MSRPAMEHSGWHWINGGDISPSFVVINADQDGVVVARITVWDEVVETISLQFDRVSQVIELLIEIADTVPWRIESTMRIADDRAAEIAEAASPSGIDGPRLFDLLITRNESLRSVWSSDFTLAEPTRSMI